MARTKFDKPSSGLKAQSVLAKKLDLIACELANEVLGIKPDREVNLAFDDKLGALKTLTAYYAMVAKVEPPEELGNGFASYRSTVQASNDRGNGDGNAEIDLSGEVE